MRVAGRLVGVAGGRLQDDAQVLDSENAILGAGSGPPRRLDMIERVAIDNTGAFGGF
jgi:hypothetical protein